MLIYKISLRAEAPYIIRNRIITYPVSYVGREETAAVSKSGKLELY